MYAAYVRIVQTPRLLNSQTPKQLPKQNYNNYNNFCPNPLSAHETPPLHFIFMSDLRWFAFKKLAFWGHKNADCAQRCQWNRRTNPMELFNKINGIVQRNQWICLPKLAFSLTETARITPQKLQISFSNACGATRITMNTHEWFMNDSWAIICVFMRIRVAPQAK